MAVKDAMKELYTLGSNLRLGEADTQLSPTERLIILKGGIKEMLTNNGIPDDVDLQEQRFSASRCKVQVLLIHSVKYQVPDDDEIEHSWPLELL
jgi:hypothetical protein